MLSNKTSDKALKIEIPHQHRSGIYNLLAVGLSLTRGRRTYRSQAAAGKGLDCHRSRAGRGSKGNINIKLQKLNSQPAAPPTAIARVVRGNSLGKDVWGLFFRDRMRFPRGGGYVVDPDVAYDLKVEGKDATDTPVQSAIDGQYAFARGAIVNMKVKL
jgi:hypothetical protein